MYRYDVTYMKGRQEKFESQKETLLNVLSSFRTGLIEGLSTFTDEAIKMGLTGVKACQTVEHTDGTLEVAFALNDCNLLLVATNSVACMEDLTPLCSRMFIYPDEGSRESRPLACINVYKLCDEESYGYRLIAFGVSGPQRIAAGTTVDEYYGGQAAQELVLLFYDKGAIFWADQPTLAEMRKREHRLVFRLGNEAVLAKV
jgi:hypothetical protein